jgi:hypothetical protein
MQVLEAEYQFDRHKLTFYFAADRRIDFRDLVSELFSQYKTRIWMQQVDTASIATNDAGSELARATGFVVDHIGNELNFNSKLSSFSQGDDITTKASSIGGLIGFEQGDEHYFHSPSSGVSLEDLFQRSEIWGLDGRLPSNSAEVDLDF